MLNAGSEGAEIEETNIQGGSCPSAKFPRDRGSRHAASFTKFSHGLDPRLDPLHRQVSRLGKDSSEQTAHPGRYGMGERSHPGRDRSAGKTIGVCFYLSRVKTDTWNQEPGARAFGWSPRPPRVGAGLSGITGRTANRRRSPRSGQLAAGGPAPRRRGTTPGCSRRRETGRTDSPSRVGRRRARNGRSRP